MAAIFLKGAAAVEMRNRWASTLGRTQRLVLFLFLDRCRAGPALALPSALHSTRLQSLVTDSRLVVLPRCGSAPQKADADSEQRSAWTALVPCLPLLLQNVTLVQFGSMYAPAVCTSLACWQCHPTRLLLKKTRLPIQLPLYPIIGVSVQFPGKNCCVTS